MVEVERELAERIRLRSRICFESKVTSSRHCAAEARLLAAVLLTEGRLTRQQKEGLLYAVASARGKVNIASALYAQAIPADDESLALLTDFAPAACLLRSLVFGQRY